MLSDARAPDAHKTASEEMRRTPLASSRTRYACGLSALTTDEPDMDAFAKAIALEIEIPIVPPQSRAELRALHEAIIDPLMA